MNYPTVWELALMAVVAIALLWMRYALPSYFAEKGKNLASKEDLEELTRKVEGVKAQHVSDLERLRFDLARASLIQRAQYETEFRIYEEIWQCLTNVHRTVLALRPMVDYADPNESDSERRNRRIREFGEAFNAMQTAIWKSKPFYSEAVHRELQELSRLIYTEAVEYQHGDPIRDKEYWREAQKNIETISKQIEAVCEAIRQRLSGV